MLFEKMKHHVMRLWTMLWYPNVLREYIPCRINWMKIILLTATSSVFCFIQTRYKVLEGVRWGTWSDALEQSAKWHATCSWVFEAALYSCASPCTCWGYGWYVISWSFCSWKCLILYLVDSFLPTLVLICALEGVMLVSNIPKYVIRCSVGLP